MHIGFEMAVPTPEYPEIPFPEVETCSTIGTNPTDEDYPATWVWDLDGEATSGTVLGFPHVAFATRLSDPEWLEYMIPWEGLQGFLLNFHFPAMAWTHIYIPQGTTYAIVEMWGAQGGEFFGAPGGKGGYLKGRIDFNYDHQGMVLAVCPGRQPYPAQAYGAAFNEGGNGLGGGGTGQYVDPALGSDWLGGPGGGGGSGIVLLNGSTGQSAGYPFNDPPNNPTSSLICSAGGGGGASTTGTPGGGGYPNGENGSTGAVGGGPINDGFGSQSLHGQGRIANAAHSGGGGGGWRGGANGQTAGTGHPGAGASSGFYTGSDSRMPQFTYMDHDNAVREGHGRIRIELHTSTSRFVPKPYNVISPMGSGVGQGIIGVTGSYPTLPYSYRRMLHDFSNTTDPQFIWLPDNFTGSGVRIRATGDPGGYTAIGTASQSQNTKPGIPGYVVARVPSDHFPVLFQLGGTGESFSNNVRGRGGNALIVSKKPWGGVIVANASGQRVWADEDGLNPCVVAGGGGGGSWNNNTGIMDDKGGDACWAGGQDGADRNFSGTLRIGGKGGTTVDDGVTQNGVATGASAPRHAFAHSGGTAIGYGGGGGAGWRGGGAGEGSSFSPNVGAAGAGGTSYVGNGAIPEFFTTAGISGYVRGYIQWQFLR